MSSGTEAVRVFVPGGFDLVLCNLGMTGQRARTWRTRAHEQSGRPVIFITGWGLQAEDRDRCRQLGVETVLFKPVRPVEAHHAVQDALADCEPCKQRPA